MKKILLIMLITLTTLTSVFASGSDEKADNNGVVTIELWRHTGTPTEGEYYDNIINSFNAANPNIQIHQTIFPDGTYIDQINAAIATDGLPDVIDFDGVYMAGFVNFGALAPLDQYISNEMKSDLLPSIFEEGTYEDGKVYMLGQFDSGLSFWGNKSHLKATGVRIPTSVDEAWTKTEFDNALAKLSKVDGVEYALDLKVNYGGGYWIYSYLPIIRSFGGDVIDRNSWTAEGTLNGKETVAAFEYLRELVDMGYVNPTQTTDDDFYNSKTSSLALVGHWMYPPHTSSMGDDAILIPLPDFGDGVFTGSGSYGWGMTSKATSRGVDQEAWKVLEYFMSAEGINGVFEANGAVPASKTVLNSLDEYKEDGLLYLYREQLEKGKAYVRPVTPAFSTIQDQLGKAVASILAGENVQKALDDAAKEIDTVIVDNGYHGK